MHSVDLNDIYKASRSKETLKSETTNNIPLESLQSEFKTDIKHLTKADAKETRKAGLALTQELKELSKNPLEANSAIKTYLLQKNDLNETLLDIAVRDNDIKSAKALLKAAKTIGIGPVVQALLLNPSGTTNSPSSYNTCSAVTIALESKNTEMLSLLLSAAQTGFGKILEPLFKAVRNESGQTIYQAVKNWNDPKAKALEKQIVTLAKFALPKDDCQVFLSEIDTNGSIQSPGANNPKVVDKILTNILDYQINHLFETENLSQIRFINKQANLSSMDGIRLNNLFASSLSYFENSNSDPNSEFAQELLTLLPDLIQHSQAAKEFGTDDSMIVTPDIALPKSSSFTNFVEHCLENQHIQAATIVLNANNEGHISDELFGDKKIFLSENSQTQDIKDILKNYDIDLITAENQSIATLAKQIQSDIETGVNPLDAAIKSGNLELATDLVEAAKSKDIQLLTPETKKESPMMAAIRSDLQKNNTTMTQFILDQGVSPTVDDVYEAVTCASPIICALLLSKTENISQLKNTSQDNILHHVSETTLDVVLSMFPDQSTVKSLLITPNKSGQTALMEAAKKPEVFKSFLKLMDQPQIETFIDKDLASLFETKNYTAIIACINAISSPSKRLGALKTSLNETIVSNNSPAWNVITKLASPKELKQILKSEGANFLSQVSSELIHSSETKPLLSNLLDSIKNTDYSDKKNQLQDTLLHLIKLESKHKTSSKPSLVAQFLNQSAVQEMAKNDAVYAVSVKSDKNPLILAKEKNLSAETATALLGYINQMESKNKNAIISQFQKNVGQSPTEFFAPSPCAIQTTSAPHRQQSPLTETNIAPVKPETKLELKPELKPEIKPETAPQEIKQFNQEKKELLTALTHLNNSKTSQELLDGLSTLNMTTLKDVLHSIIQDSNPKDLNQCSKFYMLLKTAPKKTDTSKSLMAAFSGTRLLDQFSNLSTLISSSETNTENTYHTTLNQIKDHYLAEGSSIEDILKDFGTQVKGSKIEKALSAASIQTLQAEFMKMFINEHLQINAIEQYTVTHVSNRSITNHSKGVTIGSTFHYQIADSSGSGNHKPMFSFPLTLQLDQKGNFLSYSMGEKTMASGLSPELQTAINKFSSKAFQKKYTADFQSNIKKCLDDIPQLAKDLNRELGSMTLSTNSDPIYSKLQQLDTLEMTIASKKTADKVAKNMLSSAIKDCKKALSSGKTPTINSEMIIGMLTLFGNDFIEEAGELALLIGKKPGQTYTAIQKKQKEINAQNLMNNASALLNLNNNKLLNEKYPIQNFEDLKILMSAAKRSTDSKKSEAFLSIYNEQVSPKLTTEMDALEYLNTKIAYLHLKPGNTIQFNINQNTETIGNTNRTSKYANHYKVDTSFTNKLGMVAYGLIPVNDSGEKIDNHAPILLFRGTASGMDRSAKAAGHKKGMRADVDPLGIGYSAFKESESKLAEWIQTNPKTAVMGHSLGGAFAYRIACSTALPEDIRQNLTISTFQAPGIDKETAKNNKVPAKNIVGQFGKGDVVISAGEEHLEAGSNYTHSAGSNIKTSHLETPNVKRLLNDKSANRKTLSGQFKTDPSAEKIRKALSAFEKKIPL
jgi:hypothetical protein